MRCRPRGARLRSRDRPDRPGAGYGVAALGRSGGTAAVVGAFGVGFGVARPAVLAPRAAWYAEFFDTEFRLTGFAFSGEIGSAVAGGLPPFIATAIYAWADHWWPFVVYMGLLSVITLAALAFGPEAVGRHITDGETVQPAAPTRHPSADTTTHEAAWRP
ncbi:hypothetical protein [Streptomyces sp. NPDC050535]|uniref:hypothetical protein n=1 Tax=Streptomyces sp. NPDC050535 TaxID=3365626 RepID=UPI0037AD4059